MIVTGDAAHIIVDGRRHRQRLARQIDIGEDLAGLGDARQALVQHLGIDMIEVQVDIVAILADAAAFAHLGRHRARHDVAAGEILGRGSVALHEALALGVGEIAAFAARALGDEHARAVDTGRVKLDELHVLERQPRAQHHAAAVAGAGMRRGRGEIGAARAARREHNGMAAEAMDRAIVHAERDHTLADAIVHDQVEREIFDEEVRVVLQALLVQRVQHGVTGPVGRGAGALHRRARAHILHMAAERTLIDLALVGAAERHAGMLELDHRGGRLAHHIFDGILVAEPVRPLDGIVHVPGPVIRAHITQRGGDAALRRDGMAAGREHLGDARGLETGTGGAHGSAQARSARADDHRIIEVVDDLVSLGHQAATPPNAIFRIEKIARAAPAIA